MNTLKCLLVMMLSVSLHSARAQDIFDKVDKLLNKTEKASNQTDRAGKTAGKLGKLFGKKEKSGQKTVISISGIDYANLQDLQARIEGCSGVVSATSKFNKDGSKITVMHSTTSSDLLKEILKKANGILTKESIEEVEDDAISFRLN